MFAKYSTRRAFLKYGSLSLLFLLNSCSNVSKKIKIALQNSFYPDLFKDTIPDEWEQKDINFGGNYIEKSRNIILDSDLTLINDGWLNSINFNEFNNLNQPSLIDKLDSRSISFLSTFEENYRNKLFPVGIVPYSIIIKNNKDLINSARQNWDFLLSSKLNRKIIFPKSPRIIISIAKKINSSNSLSKLKDQAMLFDDQNSLNWLINSDACLAIIPYSFCLRYLKIDSRLSVVFPNQGVPLMWHFILSRSNNYREVSIWIKFLESKLNAYKLARKGWFLPFKKNYKQDKNTTHYYKYEISGPSQLCWENSWSFPLLTKSEKINLENYWNQSLTP